VATGGLLTGVRAVAFDAVGTLITPDPPVQVVYEAVGRRHGSRRTGEEIHHRFRVAFRSEEDRDRAAGWRTDPAREVERWRRIVAAVLDDAADPEACFRELWNHFARPAAWRCLPDVGAALAALAQRGVAVGLASNFDSRLRAVAGGLPELATVGPVVVSAEVGWRKPAAAFFAAAVRAFGRAAGDVLLVGDDFENDYLGATAAGLRAVLLDPAGRAGGDIARIAGLADLQW
jgi:putative hydrolase of the HAD superfamily